MLKFSINNGKISRRTYSLLHSVLDERVQEKGQGLLVGFIW